MARVGDSTSRTTSDQTAEGGVHGYAELPYSLFKHIYLDYCFDKFSILENKTCSL